MEKHARRQFLARCATIGVAGLGGCVTPADLDGRSTPPEDRAHRDAASVRGSSTVTRTTAPDTPTTPVSDDPVDVRGAIYLSTRAFNFYQQWQDYDRDEIERDLGYAATLNLNALRTWLSYEAWLEAPDALGRRIDHFLETAHQNDMRVLLGLFEGVGDAPTRKNLTNRDLKTAVGVFSPSMDIVRDESQWDKPREFVTWFMDRYRDDERLLAIEVMNEPGWTIRQEFARGMFRTLVEERGDVPLTVGSTSLANNSEYVQWGIDVLQFHYNFPVSRDIYRDLFEQAASLAANTSKPIWLTEWQRLRNETGFIQEIGADEWQPNYASLAPVIHEYNIGNFFWSLMLKPAYATSQRERGVLTGIFHEDGTVWSREDARAIKAMSGDSSIDVDERQEWPQWANAVRWTP